jgi:hypothetical protein
MTLLYLQLKKELRNKTEELERVFTYNYSLTTKKDNSEENIAESFTKEAKKRKEKKRKERKRKRKKDR